MLRVSAGRSVAANLQCVFSSAAVAGRRAAPARIIPFVQTRLFCRVPFLLRSFQTLESLTFSFSY